jgi:FMN-dependent NADH-azoreductase
MKNVLLVLSSPRGQQSYSHQFASHIVDDLKARNPGVTVVVRDLVKEPVPHVAEAFVERAFA